MSASELQHLKNQLDQINIDITERNFQRNIILKNLKELCPHPVELVTVNNNQTVTRNGEEEKRDIAVCSFCGHYWIYEEKEEDEDVD